MFALKIEMHIPPPPPQEKIEEKQLWRCTVMKMRMHALRLCKTEENNFCVQPFLCVCVREYACAQPEHTYTHTTRTHVYVRSTHVHTYVHTHRGTVKHRNYCKYIHAHAHRQNLGFPAKLELFGVIKKSSLQQSA